MLKWIAAGFNAASTLTIVASLAAAAFVAVSMFLTSLPLYGQVVAALALFALIGAVAVPSAYSVGSALRDWIVGVPRLEFLPGVVETHWFGDSPAPPDVTANPVLARGTAVTSGSVVSSPTYATMIGERIEFGYARIRNVTKNRRVDATALRAVVELEYFDPSGVSILGPFPGRWANSSNPAVQPVFSTPANYDEWRIPDNGVAEPIDLIYKGMGDDACWVYTNTSARLPLRDRSTRIAEREFSARVTVSGGNFAPCTAIYRVSHGGPGTAPIVKLERAI